MDEPTLELPRFRYHPDPVGTGAVVAGDDACDACGRSPGWVYAGPVYSEGDEPTLCPWCIADGSAARKFDAEFTDVGDAPDDIPVEVLEVLARRTPGFPGWQQEYWCFHCGDAAAYVGAEQLPGAGSATTYRFRCLTCGADVTYDDAD